MFGFLRVFKVSDYSEEPGAPQFIDDFGPLCFFSKVIHCEPCTLFVIPTHFYVEAELPWRLTENFVVFAHFYQVELAFVHPGFARSLKA